jgi:hypothetical protein
MGHKSALIKNLPLLFLLQIEDKINLPFDSWLCVLFLNKKTRRLFLKNRIEINESVSEYVFLVYHKYFIFRNVVLRHLMLIGNEKLSSPLTSIICNGFRFILEQNLLYEKDTIKDQITKFPYLKDLIAKHLTLEKKSFRQHFNEIHHLTIQSVHPLFITTEKTNKLEYFVCVTRQTRWKGKDTYRFLIEPWSKDLQTRRYPKHLKSYFNEVKQTFYPLPNVEKLHLKKLNFTIVTQFTKLVELVVEVFDLTQFITNIPTLKKLVVAEIVVPSTRKIDFNQFLNLEQLTIIDYYQPDLMLDKYEDVVLDLSQLTNLMRLLLKWIYVKDYENTLPESLKFLESWAWKSDIKFDTFPNLLYLRLCGSFQTHSVKFPSKLKWFEMINTSKTSKVQIDKIPGSLLVFLINTKIFHDKFRLKYRIDSDRKVSLSTLTKTHTKPDLDFWNGDMVEIRMLSKTKLVGANSEPNFEIGIELAKQNLKLYAHPGVF